MSRTKPTLPSNPARKHRILVISTDLDMCAALSAACGSMSELISAVDWRSAVALLKEQKPDLVVLDDFCFDGDASREFEEAWSRLSSAPVIVGTGSRQIADWVKLMRAGAADVLPKPINSEEFRRMMAKTLARGKSLRKMRRIRALTFPKSKERMPAFVKSLCRSMTREIGNEDIKFTAGAIDVLVQYATRHGLEKLNNVVARAVILNTAAVVKLEYLQNLIDETELISKVQQAALDRAWNKYDHEGEYKEYRLNRRLC